MKKIIFAVIVAALLSSALITLSTNAFAAGSYTLISGPDGGATRNGWYIYNQGLPTITIQAGTDSSCGGTGTFTLPLAPGGADNMGSHVLRYFYAPDDPKDDLWVSRDGVLLGTMCNQDMSYTGTTVTVWQGTLKYDGWAPVVSISTPANNSNTSSATVTVSGKAYDTGSDSGAECQAITRCSGLAGVTVNGVSASISGDTFSVTIPLNKGLNTVTAIASDNAGFTTTSSAITILRSDDVTGSAGTQPGQKSSASGTQTGDQNSQSAKAGSSSTTPTSSSKPPNIVQKIPTPVKAAGGAGIGLGVVSALGYVPYKKIGLFVAKIVSK